jgi:hypothetical protein
MKYTLVYILLFGYTITTHALARIVELGEQVLGREVASSYDAGTYRDRRPIALEPSARSGKHCRKSSGDSSAGDQNSKYSTVQKLSNKKMLVGKAAVHQGCSSFPWPLFNADSDGWQHMLYVIILA